jgi:hypothetical protein
MGRRGAMLGSKSPLGLAHRVPAGGSLRGEASNPLANCCELCLKSPRATILRHNM